MLESTTSQPENLHQLLFGSTNPVGGLPEDEPLLIDAHNTDRFYSFSDLRNNVCAFAHAILGPSCNLKQGDVVSICSPNDVCIAFISVHCSCGNILLHRSSITPLFMVLLLQV